MFIRCDDDNQSMGRMRGLISDKLTVAVKFLVEEQE